MHLALAVIDVGYPHTGGPGASSHVACRFAPGTSADVFQFPDMQLSMYTRGKEKPPHY